MDQIKNIWLNEYVNLQHWVAGGVHTVHVEWPELRNGVSTIVRRTLYKGKDEQRALAIFAAKVAE